MRSKQQYADVYRADHSPWVQPVLLALHEQNIPHSVATMPPLKLFRQSGILMPAVQFDGGARQMQSQEILCELGYQQIS